MSQKWLKTIRVVVMIIFRFIKLFIKLIVCLIALPFLLIYICLKYALVKYNFSKEVQKYGMNKKDAKLIISGISPFGIFKN